LFSGVRVRVIEAWIDWLLGEVRAKEKPFHI